MKYWFDYIKEQYDEGNFVSSIYWTLEVIKGNCVVLGGISCPLSITPVQEGFILNTIKKILDNSIVRSKVSFIFEMSIEILIRLKKFDFLFNEFLLKIKSQTSNQKNSKLFGVFIRLLASFLKQVKAL